jgi:glutathione S-transferase
MSGFVVHGIPGSPYVRAAVLVLEEKRAPYHFAAMPFGGHKQPAHLARHPFGRIPAIEHDGFALYETQAILRYVDAVVPNPPLQPADPREAARMNQLMGITDWYFMPQISRPIVFQRLVAPRLGRPIDEASIAAAMPDARACVAEIDRLLDGNTWLAGDSVTLADLVLAPHLSMFAQTEEGKDILRDHPALTGWLARIEARPSMQATTWEAMHARAQSAA